MCTWWMYFGVLNLVYLVARFGILAGWICCTGCTWWLEFGILWWLNLVYFVAVLGGWPNTNCQVFSERSGEY